MTLTSNGNTGEGSIGDTPPPARIPRHLQRDEDIEERSVDERLYSSWLTQITNPSSPDTEIDLSRRDMLMDGLVGNTDTVPVSDDPRTRALSGVISSLPQQATESPPAWYRWAITLGIVLVVAAVILSYEIVLPQQRATSYRDRIAGAARELDSFKDSYREILGGRFPADLREASAEARSAVAAVASFRKTATEQPPRRLPFTLYPGNPDPVALRSRALSLVDSMEPLFQQLQLRASLYGALADYAEQLDILSNLTAENGLEGNEQSVVLRGISLNIESIRASLLGVAVPTGCEELHRRVMASSGQLIAATKAAVEPSGAQTGTTQPDLLQLRTVVEGAKSALQTPIRQAAPTSTFDDVDAVLNQFQSDYGLR
jgi:hypothetical protein